MQGKGWNGKVRKCVALLLALVMLASVTLPSVRAEGAVVQAEGSAYVESKEDAEGIGQSQGQQIGDGADASDRIKLYQEAVYQEAAQDNLTEEQARAAAKGSGDGGDIGGSNSKGLGVAYRTPLDVINFLNAGGEKPGNLQCSYVDAPSLTAPYSAGSLSEQTLNSAVTMLNQIRYIAGLPADVTLNESYSQQAQAAALVGYLNGEGSHTPAQPAGMSDTLYQLGAQGAENSNLTRHELNKSLNQTLVYDWLDCSYTEERKTVEARRWLLNPAMKQTGFGAVRSDEEGGYHSYAMYAKDGGAGASDIRGVAWPAQSTPTEYFQPGSPWSVTMGEYVDSSVIQVTLTREGDGKVWRFSQESTDKNCEFYVDNGEYGQTGCIIFRPTPWEVQPYNDEDIFHVEITRDGEEYVSYDVHFFELAKTYQIIYYLNGGQNNSNNQERFRSVDGAPLYEPVREGYVFGGWFLDVDRNRRITEIPEGLNRVVRVFARWGYPDPTGTSKGVHSAYHSQEEIASYMKQSGVTLKDKVAYQAKPSTKAPYSAGSLTQQTLESALAMLNQVRYIGGVPDHLTLKDEYNKVCQAGAVLTAVYYRETGELDHFPPRPSDMSKDFYDLGIEGTGQSNLGAGYSTLNEAIARGWLGDHGERNQDVVGHRRWALYPAMKQVGFGAADNAYAMFSLDTYSQNITEDAGYGVVWPARNMPVEYFATNFPWSITMGEIIEKEDIPLLQVTLTRKNDGKVWKFSQNNTADGHFAVNNSNYGQVGCIIFMPNSIESYEAGDVFHVDITKNGEEYIYYDVNFFSPDAVDTDIDTSDYQIKYILNGGQNHGQNPESYTAASETIVLQAPTREGYLFGGWFKDRKFKNPVTEIPSGSTGDLILYAKWTLESGEGSDDGDDVGELHVALTEGSVYTYTGKAIQPKVVVTQGNKTLMAGVDYTVKYSNNLKASTAATSNKKPKITVTGKGNYSGSDSVEFTIQPKSLDNRDSGVNDTMEIRCAESLYVLVNSQIAPTLFYGSLKLGTKDYYLSTNASSEVKPWKATAGDNGTVYVTAKPGGNYTGQIAMKVIGVEKGEFKKLTVTPKKGYQPIYNGKEQKPTFGGAGSGADVEVSAKDAAEPLVEGTDYYVVYLGNATDAGTVRYRVVGLGLYAGSVTKSYKISPIRAAETDMQLGGSLTGEHPYQSKGAVINDLTVTYKGGAVNGQLVAGKDYKVTYSGNKKVGTGKFTVTFMGNYKGSKPLKNNTFQIVPAKWDADKVKVAIPDQIYKKSGFYKSSPVVSLDGVALKSSDYTLDYYYLDGAGNKQTMNSKNKLTLGDSEKSVTVYVDIVGKGNYSAESSATGTFQVRRLSGKEVDLSKAKVTFYDENGVKNKVTYTGGLVEPARMEVTCKVGNDTVKLVEDQDYIVTYANNRNKGKATVILTGTGMRNAKGIKFVGSKKATFSIAPMKVTGKITYDNVGQAGAAFMKFWMQLKGRVIQND